MARKPRKRRIRIAATAAAAIPLVALALAPLLLLASTLGAAAQSGGTSGSQIDRGARLFAVKCGRCHMIGADAHHRVGPHLNEIIGRTAGTAVGFKYSTAMEHAGLEGLTWSAETLRTFIGSPRALVTRTRMAFGGLDDADERDAIVAFLEHYSSTPSDIPEAAPTASRAEIELPPELLAAKGDPAYGEYLSGECVTCHQITGESTGGIPAITGWPEGDFKAALHAYRAKIRPHPVMQMIADRLSDDEIAALAAYFAEQGQ